eukprot:7378640-Prymnesium_polylepis.1
MKSLGPAPRKIRLWFFGFAQRWKREVALALIFVAEAGSLFSSISDARGFNPARASHVSSENSPSNSR